MRDKKGTKGNDERWEENRRKGQRKKNEGQKEKREELQGSIMRNKRNN